MKLEVLELDDPIIEADNAVFEACLLIAEDKLISDEAGYFGPESVVWKIFREPCILLGGYRAIMLQMAHPAVAQGVEQSSSFRNDMIGRARRTIQAMNSLIFGSKEQALKAATIMHHIHHQVKGVVPDGIDSSWAGQRFRANALDLKNWVGLTTFDTVIIYFEKFVRPLSSVEKEQLAQEGHTLALLCGLPPEYHHQTLESQIVLRDEIFAGDELVVADVASGIVKDLFGVTPGSLDERITYGLLPPAVRELYQIPWSDADQEAHEKLAQKISFLNRSLPKAVRYIPAWYQANTRVLKANSDGGADSSGWLKQTELLGRSYLRLFGSNAVIEAVDSQENRPEA
ncbi:MAG: oxygenase MpaB family protein [Anaerolineae bacterium]